jgi:imidazolonepropionase-like amidohydrolase
MDFVKAYDRLSRDVYLAIVDEAKRQALPVAGHVPLSMTGAEVSDLGQISIEHVNNDILVSCSRDEAELRKELQERLKSSQQGAFAPVMAKAVDKYDEQKAQNFFARLRKNGTWLCPTLALHRPTELVGDESKLLTDSRLKYMPASSRERWRQSQQRSSQVATLAERKLVFDTRLKIVGVMHRTGIRLLAGADAPGPYTVPGFSLHEELETLVQAGLSPIEALRTATLNPAMFFGKEKEWGTVEKGKVADLVLLDANPLEAISNTQKIFAVIVNGKLLQRSDLDNLLRQVEEQAKK